MEATLGWRVSFNLLDNDMTPTVFHQLSIDNFWRGVEKPLMGHIASAWCNGYLNVGREDLDTGLWQVSIFGRYLHRAPLPRKPCSRSAERAQSSRVGQETRTWKAAICLLIRLSPFRKDLCYPRTCSSSCLFLKLGCFFTTWLFQFTQLPITGGDNWCTSIPTSV